MTCSNVQRIRGHRFFREYLCEIEQFCKTVLACSYEAQVGSRKSRDTVPLTEGTKQLSTVVGKDKIDSNNIYGYHYYQVHRKVLEKIYSPSSDSLSVGCHIDGG